MILRGLRVEDTPLLSGKALIQNTCTKTISIKMRFGIRWKGRDESVFLLRSVRLRIFISDSGTCYSREKILMRTLEVVFRNYSNSPSISKCTTLKPRVAASLWMFPMHLMNVSTLPFPQYSVVQKKVILKIDIKKRTPLNFITSAHTVMSLCLYIM